ncbi:MAG: YraN family protein [Bacteroidaceae bacterium]|nr:YraN family protein [Bacteroidaceae bacterium]
MSTTVYTIGLGHKSVSEIINHLRSHGVNCVVDIRTIFIHKNETLKDAFHDAGITLLSFFQEFGFIPAKAQNMHGELVYTKVVKLDSFIHGMERLKVGLEKGYIIAIMDSDTDIFNSKRHKIIGRYLDSIGITVNHIENNGSVLSYGKTNELIAQKAEARKQKKDQANELGQNGEEIAALHLMRKGHTILDKNWNLHHGCELDLITRKDGVLYFVEVKTRSSIERGSPHLAIDKRKVQHITTAIKGYISLYNYYYMPYKIMSVAIVYRSEDDYTIDFFEWGNGHE